MDLLKKPDFAALDEKLVISDRVRAYAVAAGAVLSGGAMTAASLANHNTAGVVAGAAIAMLGAGLGTASTSRAQQEVEGLQRMKEGLENRPVRSPGK